MKLKEYRQAYYDFSKSASDISRQLGFAGIAIIWLFRTDSGGVSTIPNELILPGMLIVFSLSADFMHYVTATMLWGGYTYYKEKTLDNTDDDFTVPEQMNWPQFVFWYTKIGLMMGAYFLLITFFIKKFSLL